MTTGRINQVTIVRHAADPREGTDDEALADRSELTSAEAPASPAHQAFFAIATLCCVGSFVSTQRPMPNSRLLRTRRCNTDTPVSMASS